MKNVCWIVNVVLAFLFSACSHADMVELESSKKGTYFTATDFVFDGMSRTSVEITETAAVFSWSANDTIGIFPDTDASQARFLMLSGAGTKNATFDGGGWALKLESKYAAYYPYIPDIELDKNRIPVDYTGQVQVKPDNTEHVGRYDFMAATAMVPTDGEVCFDFKHLNSLVQLKLTLPKAADYTSITLKAEKNLFPIHGEYNLMSSDVQIEHVELLDSLVLELKDFKTVVDGQEILAYLMMPPTDLAGENISVIVRGNDGLCVEGNLQMKNLVAGTAYTFSSALNVTPDDGGGDEEGITMVDVAGTLEALLGDDKFVTSKLVVKGKLNSDDIALLRKMSGGFQDTTDVVFGRLKDLDLSQVTLVPGGSYYLDDGNMKYKIASSYAIDDFMFFGCDTLESLVLPDGVTSIGEAAISNCSRLKHIVIPNSVKKIGVAAFKSSNSLNGIQLPSGLQELGTDVFHSCRSLQRIVIPEGITTIDSRSFGHCDALEDVVLPEGLVSIGSAAFASCQNLKTIVIPNSVGTIGERAFGSCVSLVDVTLSTGMSSLGSNVFENCTGLQSIVIPEGMTTIESRAFNGCPNLKEFILPSTLLQLKDRAFYSAALMEPIVVKCYAIDPPVVGTSVWKSGDFSTSSKLYVPVSAIDDYKSSGWVDYFGEILPFE